MIVQHRPVRIHRHCSLCEKYKCKRGSCYCIRSRLTKEESGKGRSILQQLIQSVADIASTGLGDGKDGYGCFVWDLSSKILTIREVSFDFPLNLKELGIRNSFTTTVFEKCVFKEEVTLEGEEGPTGRKFDLQYRLIADRCCFEKRLRIARANLSKPLEIHECRMQEYVEILNSSVTAINLHDTVFEKRLYLQDVDIGKPFRESFVRNKIDSLQLSYFGNLYNVRFGKIFWKESDENRQESGLIADFSEISLKGGAVFWDISFYGNVSFKRADFYETTDFTNPQFFRVLPYADRIFSLEESHMAGAVSIRGTGRDDKARGSCHIFSFENSDASSRSMARPEAILLNFRNISILKEGGLILQTCNLERAKVLGTNLSRCTFQNVIWPQIRPTYWMCILNSREWEFELLPRWISRVLYHINREFQLTQLVPSLLPSKDRVVDHFKRKPGHNYGIYDHKLMRDELEQEAQKPIPYRPNMVEEHLKRAPTTCEKRNLLKQRTSLTDDQICAVLAGAINVKDVVTAAQDHRWLRWRHDWTLISKAYRDLKKSYEDSKDYIYASDFNFGEKEMRRINHEVPWPTRWQLHLFKFISGYGERILRPTILLALLWVFGIVIYKCPFGGPMDFSDAIHYSASHMALLRPELPKYLKEVTVLPVGLKLTSLIQNFLGPIWGAMLVLAITNKLKR